MIISNGDSLLVKWNKLNMAILSFHLHYVRPSDYNSFVTFKCSCFVPRSQLGIKNTYRSFYPFKVELKKSLLVVQVSTCNLSMQYNLLLLELPHRFENIVLLPALEEVYDLRSVRFDVVGVAHMDKCKVLKNQATKIYKKPRLSNICCNLTKIV